MKFSAITLLACAAIAQSAALPETVTTSADAPISTALNSVIPDFIEFDFSGKFDASGSLVAQVDDEPTQALQKRVGALVKVIGMATIKGIQLLTEMAIEHGGDTIKNLGEWNQAREEFSKATTADMWARNPDYRRYPAVICYNKGYSVKNPAGIVGKVSAKLSLGFLNTDYDCMYMTGNNQFYTHAEGGYINLSYKYNNRCSHDRNTGDLTCN
ncbi:uncharacterized protein EAF01_005765 [Botrytis porri]|uniref:DUF7888 domain-containing protein n=1 Tax=Botrytis porri TaxID=87229 RepID=A0A4Z1K917_9HELO|nr:uncharacterized protein EAF01_005765 [Botrytis porri]KAF7905244.1 hypothetical protein EAF01_005765 [Botrytis porri]TGO81966.1 hypothetical protein BPOR_0959g00010 [Botrytis porri]